MASLNFYVYAYLRLDGTPYYIGKGKELRAWIKGKGEVKPPKDPIRIILVETNLTDIGALAIERRLIRWYGRKDVGTGILHNKTDGGDGSAGRKISKEQITKQVASKIKNGNIGKGKKQLAEHVKKRADSIRGRKHTDAHKEAAAAPKRGIKHTVERCNNISIGLKGNIPWNKGLHTGPRSVESIEKQKNNSKGINSGPQNKIKCPHCNKIGGVSNMKRYHFYNCSIVSTALKEF
jgi:hypothetical protein